MGFERAPWPAEAARRTPGAHDGPAPLYVPADVMQRMALPRGRPLIALVDAGNELHVGPFIGIYCQRYTGSSLYGPQTAFFRRLIRLGRMLNMCVYVFEARDVDVAKAVVHGVTWEEGRGWVRMRFPLPHVLYDRGMVDGRVMRVQHWLRRRGVEQFNSWVGSKLWVYRQMARVPALAQYIPETVVLRRTADLASMLRRHGTVYVKAAGGGKGIGIWLVKSDGRGGCSYRYTDARCRIRGGRTRDLSQLVNMLLSRPRRPWLIQPEDRPAPSSRPHLRRTSAGATGRRRRAARHRHRRADRPSRQLHLQHFRRRRRAGGWSRSWRKPWGLDASGAAAMRREIERIALEVAHLIHRACRRTGHVGELGVDIGIDRHGRLWFFEANSRTGRNVFQMAGMRESARDALRRPMEFALYLSGFSGRPKAAEAV